MRKTLGVKTLGFVILLNLILAPHVSLKRLECFSKQHLMLVPVSMTILPSSLWHAPASCLICHFHPAPHFPHLELFPRPPDNISGLNAAGERSSHVE